MSWRYMAARETTGGEEVWTIREVYDGTGWTASAAAPTGSSHADLREVLRMMTFDIEHRDFLDLDAERDALAAKVERVRALADNPYPDARNISGNDILRALDGEADR